jgi:hypothetical protein
MDEERGGNMAKKFEFRILVFVLALLVTLGAFLSVSALYRKYQVERPMVEDLQKLAGGRVELEKEKNGYQVTLIPGKVDNLQDYYLQAQKSVTSRLSGKEAEIIIEDQPSPKLQAFYTKMQPAIYESLATGRFVWLEEEIARRSADSNIRFQLLVDNDFLYLQMEDRDGYLYRVIERTSWQSNGEGVAAS